MERDVADLDSPGKGTPGERQKNRGGPLFDLKEVIPPQSREDSFLFFSETFGTDSALVVEIGSGNGHFLVDYAKKHPQYNFIGTELLRGRARKFASKIQKRDLKNVVVFLGDARRFVWEFLYENSVEEFIILFPDPWPKKRHYKHRLLSAPFIQMLFLRLLPGGLVSLATDCIEYRNHIIKEFGTVAGFRSPFPSGYSGYPAEYPKTLYENKLKRQGKPLFYMQWVKET
jgi:tRNA (guanine-N7-)-methyltransferase